MAGRIQLAGAGTAITSTASHAPLPGMSPEFVAIQMPEPAKAVARAAVRPTAAAPIDEAPIHIELRRGPLHLNVRWPTAAAADCRAWLSELSSGLLK